MKIVKVMRKMFIKIASHNKQVQQYGYRGWVERLTRQQWPGSRIDWSIVNGAVHAEIARSHWRACCPYCRGAILIEPNELFFDPDCGMQGNDFKPMAILWPERWKEIEAVLVKRSNPISRNWVFGETIEDLIQQNKDKGEW